MKSHKIVEKLKTVKEKTLEYMDKLKTKKIMDLGDEKQLAKILEPVLKDKKISFIVK